jgi:O-antigen/teichoic acid export membrane protein
MNVSGAAATPMPSHSQDVGSIKGRVIRGGSLLMTARLLVQVFAWSVTLLVARLLTPVDYGVMTAGMLFIGLSDLLAEAGIGRALVQKQELMPADLSGAFTLNLAISVVLYVVVILGAGSAATAMGIPALQQLLPVLGIIVLISPFRTVPLALLDRELRLSRQAFVHVLCAVTQSLAVWALAWAGAGYWSLAVGALLARLLECGAFWYASGWRPRLAWLGREQRGIIWFGIHASVSSLLWFAYSNADFAILGKLSGPLVLGYYALAFQIISLPVQKLTANANQVAYPVFCRLQADRDRLRDWYLRLTVLLGSLGLPALVGLALVARDAVQLLLGDRWLPAVVPLQLLSIVGVLMVCSHTLPPLFNALGRPDINSRYSAVCAVVFPAGFVLGAWTAGLLGVCAAWTILYPVVFVGFVQLSRPASGISLIDLAKSQAPVVGAGITMAVVVLAVQRVMAAEPANWRRLAACVGAGVLTYVLALAILGWKSVLTDVYAVLNELRGGVASLE